ncbi:hypothetical protein SPSYN_01897 [Sporotomaculum syntrophicum]|uniref:DUF2148 domain-containing protein n=1 Tax=Sporotomaculum syntrophicum TaxID=182264 RepID=A0A9D2WQT9_9FIRM|nr:DUF2148 domain-containing protein [Sporotomaculum syntrophicum]KAF1085749.1 hypothetical protein SPSYN_01897 [Sporotomaculum syntrophicum]
MFCIMQTVAELMALAARTAPKGLGQDYLDIQVLVGDDLLQLADEMDRFGKATGRINFDRDAENIRRSDAVLLVSLRENEPLGLNCGACGHDTCTQLASRQGPEFEGPLCAWRVVDLGIAVGSAAKTAGLLNADNRVMYRPAAVARRMGFVQGALVCAIPISATGKNIYFDRPVK